jgi:hypothetical protein
VSEWEYRKIALNQLSPKMADVDLLNDAGAEGWELVAILPNNIAYLKRQVRESVPEARQEETRPNGIVSSSTPTVHSIPDPVHDDDHRAEVKAKYRDPTTGETWSGRGRMASWLKRKQDAGEDIEKYRV